MNEQELREQCKREAEAKYPPHLAPDEIIGDHFMLVRAAVANTLHDERTKALRLVEAGNALADRVGCGCGGDNSECGTCNYALQAWDAARASYT